MNMCLDLQITILSDSVRSHDLYFPKTYKTDRLWNQWTLMTSWKTTLTKRNKILQLQPMFTNIGRCMIKIDWLNTIQIYPARFYTLTLRKVEISLENIVSLSSLLILSWCVRKMLYLRCFKIISGFNDDL